MAGEAKLFGALAEFESATTLFSACEQVRDAKYSRWDSHTPFPVHNLDKAMGLPASKLPWLVLGGGLTGAAGGMGLQWWTSAVDYPVVISGKELFSWQAFVPVMFELMVLCAVLGAVLGLFHMCRLPQLYSPLFQSEAFERATDDKFFISIEAVDPLFDEADTVKFLESIGAVNVELIPE